MVKLTSDQIANKARDLVVESGTKFRFDQVTAYEKAILKEENKQARWVLEKILENAKIAESKKIPLCDDTGVPHIYLEVGAERALPAGFFESLSDGVKAGLKKLPGRPMAVKGNDSERISQTAGLYDDDSAALAMAPIQIRTKKGNKIRITVLMLGGGPEIRAKTYRVFHKHSIKEFMKEITQWALEEVSKLGCLPCIAAFGVGRTHVEASSLMLEAMANGDLTRQNNLEQQITKDLNNSGIGPLAIGGNTTVLGTFLNIGPQRASGVRIVSMRLCCCFEPRSASAIF